MAMSFITLEVIPALKESLQRSGKADTSFVIIGFSHPTMQAIKKALPNIEAYWLSSFTADAQTGVLHPTVDELIQKANAAGVEGINLSYRGPIDAAFVKQVKEAGLKCYVWTVDSPDDARRLIAAGVDGMTTNRPAWLREQLKAK